MGGLRRHKRSIEARMSSADLAAEGCWIGVLLIEKGHDVGVQGGHAAIEFHPELALGNECEEALDLVAP